MDATQSSTVIQTLIEPSQAVNILAVFGGLNIFIWLFKAGMIFEKFRNRKGKWKRKH